MKKLLICLALLLISQDLFAESNIFTIPQSDLSMKLLNHVFGTVGTIVTGFVSQTALTNVLKYFNNACLVLGGILILYSLIVSTINTAHDGEMLGKKWNSVWIPIRAALGFGLLLPTKATLVVIQVFVIWVVVQGVGAADYLWQNTIEQPENYMPPPQLASPMDYQSVLSAASLTFVNQVTQNLTAQLASTNTEPVTPKNTDTGSAIQLGISSIPNNPALCGSVGYETVNHSATQTFVDNIASSATNDFLSDYDANNPQALTTSQISSIQNSLVAASKAYISAAMQTQEQFQQQGALHADYSVDNNTLKNMIENGWISAGSYYMMISKSSQMQTYVTISPPSITQPDATSIQSVLGQQNAEEVQFAVRTAVRASCLSATAGQCVTPADAGATTQLQIERPTGLIQKILMVINPAYDFLQAVLAGLTAILNSAGIGNLSHMGDVTSGYNPITSIMGWGQSILTGLANVTIVMMAVMFSVGLASYTCSCVNPAGYALSSALTWFLPFIFMIMLAAWLFGSLAAFYVPLIPYILFTLLRQFFLTSLCLSSSVGCFSCLRLNALLYLTQFLCHTSIFRWPTYPAKNSIGYHIN